MPMIILGDQTKIFYTVLGDRPLDLSKTTVIFLHGGPGLDHTLLLPFWRLLPENYQVILPDLRGCGRSDKSVAEKWNLNTWASDLDEFITRLGLIKSPFLGGISFGGYVALEFAYKQRKSKIAGLILCDTEGTVDRQAFLERLRKIVISKNGNVESTIKAAVNWFDTPSQESLGNYLTYCFPYYQNNPVIDVDTSQLILNADVLAHFNKNELFTFNLLPLLKNLTVPILYIAGEISPYHSKENALMTYEAMPKHLTSLHILKDAGTDVYHHRPKECVKLITDFLGQRGL